MAATSIELEIVKQAKEVLNAGEEGFQDFCASLFDAELSAAIAWPWIFQKVYLHACLKKRRTAAEWLRAYAAANPTIVGLGWRQTVAYGKTLLGEN